MDSGQQFDVAILGTGSEGQHQNPDEANQFAIPPFREGYEAHLHRQDIDAWLTYTAVHYVRCGCQIQDAELVLGG